MTVDYKKYGVGLAFTPTVLGRGLINLKIEPEVSQIDTTHTVTVSNGVSVPALIVRRASTTVELRDGQSFVIGGLLQNDNKNYIEQLPWLGSVPVLGALFSSEVLSEERNRSRHHRHAAPGASGAARATYIKTPTDDTLPPNDTGLLPARQDRSHARSRRRTLTPVTARIAAAGDRPFTGHMLDHAEGGFQCGHSVRCCARSRSPRLLAALAGCSEYLDRRDTVALERRQCGRDQQGRRRWSIPGRARAPTATSRSTATKMETAVERYRTNQVIPPRGIGTSGSYQQRLVERPEQHGAGRTDGNASPAAPVK